MLGAMAASPDQPIDDPLLQPERAPRDPLGTPVRAPLGNSVKTLAWLIVLVAIGVGVWWLRRPADVSDQIGAREWVITTADGRAAVNARGTVSTFVLEGSGEVRAPIECNTATGDWSYDGRSSRLVLEWTEQTTAICDGEQPTTYQPLDGEVDVGDGTLTLESTDGVIEAISLRDLTAASAVDVAGTWSTGGSVVEIGERGLFRIGACDGRWEPVDSDETAGDAVGGELAMLVEFDPVDLEGDECGLDRMWSDTAPIVPVVHDDVLYLRRDRAIFPLDRSIVRLDPADGVVPTP